MTVGVLASTAVFGAALPAQAIVGGHDVGKAQPWMAALYGKDANGAEQFDCGGTLIDAQWVLTAYHCVIYPPDHVRVGSLNRSSGGTHAGIDRIVPHPDAHLDGHTVTGPDLALIKLDKPVPGAKPVGLGTTTPPVGTPTKFLGWGDTSGDRAEPHIPEHLQEVTIPLTSSGESAGEKVLEYVDPVRGIGSGDSGGPAMVHTDQGWELAGVAHGGGQTPEGEKVSSYVDVAPYVAWAKEVIGSTSGPATQS